MTTDPKPTADEFHIIHETGAGCEWTLRVTYPDGNFNNAGYLYEIGKDYVEALSARLKAAEEERDRLLTDFDNAANEAANASYELNETAKERDALKRQLSKAEAVVDAARDHCHKTLHLPNGSTPKHGTYHATLASVLKSYDSTKEGGTC